jgi:hypothetical protein
MTMETEHHVIGVHAAKDQFTGFEGEKENGYQDGQSEPAQSAIPCSGNQSAVAGVFAAGSDTQFSTDGQDSFREGSHGTEPTAEDPSRQESQHKQTDEQDQVSLAGGAGELLIGDQGKQSFQAAERTICFNGDPADAQGMPQAHDQGGDYDSNLKYPSENIHLHLAHSMTEAM